MAIARPSPASLSCVISVVVRGGGAPTLKLSPLKFVPSYSPEYNPIETAFAWVKAHVRRTPTESIRDIPAATFTALNAVSGDPAKAWVRHSSYIVVVDVRVE